MKETRLSDNATRVYKGTERYRKDNATRTEKIKKEPKVAIYGNPLYKQFMGDVYSFDYQDNPVTIRFDGTMQYYHKTIAELINKKLDKAAKTNVPKIAGDGDKL